MFLLTFFSLFYTIFLTLPHYASKRTFTKLDNWMWFRQVRYKQKRHPRKSWKWCRPRYWGKIPGRESNWVFINPKTGQYLLQLSWIPIRRHRMVSGRSSPDDPRLRGYWYQRQKEKRSYGITLRSKLWKNQQGKCPICQSDLDNGESLHVHHIKARKDGGTNAITNLCMLHQLCHQQVHSRYSKQLKSLAAA